MISGISGLVVALSVVGAAPPVDPQGLVVEVEAGRFDRKATPVMLSLKGRIGWSDRAVLETLDRTQAVPVQILAGDHATAVWVVRDLPSGSKRRYRLRPDGRASAVRMVSCEDDGKDLTVAVRGRPVLRYNHAVDEPPPGLDRVYRRSGYIHPIFTPSGLVVTDDFPPDHAHQHGLFFAWVNTTFRGHKVDFWNQKDRTGRVRHETTQSMTGGPVFAEFTVRLRHEDVSQPGEPEPVLDETWEVRVYDVGDRPLIDFVSWQRCAGTEPLAINKYIYGGLGYRGNRAWLDPEAKGDEPPDPSRSGGSDFLTSEGKGRADGNHTRPRWVDLSGAVGGRVGGLTILDDPRNFRSPQPVRLHPNKPYLSVAPGVTGGFAIKPGAPPYVSRYRLVPHDGKPDPAETDGLWNDYAEPPGVRVVSGS